MLNNLQRLAHPQQTKLSFAVALAHALQGLHSSQWEGDEGEKFLKVFSKSVVQDP